MRKILPFILVVISLLVPFAGCSSDVDEARSTVQTPPNSNLLVGRWSSLEDVGHKIENTFGYENIEFYITTEYCFNEDHTFTFKVTDVDEEALTSIFMANQGNSPIETVNARIQDTKEILYLQTDHGTYEINGDKLILNAKLQTFEIDLKIINNKTISLTRGQISFDLNWIGNP